MNFEINIKSVSDEQNLIGVNRINLKIIESLYNVSISVKSNLVTVKDANQDTFESIEKMFDILTIMISNKFNITERDIVYIKNLLDSKKEDEAYGLYKEKKIIERNFQGKPIYPKTLKQIEYIKAIESKDIVIGVGPAGTGKTYLAVVYAVSMLKKGLVKKLILTRPAVEAGENLGFLPGDLKEKLDPYLRPIYDALYDMLGIEQTNSYIERGIIEIAPLAYMRGRTLENCCAILDEAQNTTSMQMKMFITRLGFNSKMIVNGDLTQKDLPRGKQSGLEEALYLLKNINEIAEIIFEKEDVVRHPLVSKIIDAYENN